MKNLCYKYGKIVLLVLLCLLALRLSFYTESLSARQEREKLSQFSPGQEVDYYWDNYRSSLPGRALDLSAFVGRFRQDPQALAAECGGTPGIGFKTFFLVKTETSDFTMRGDCLELRVEGVKWQIPEKVFGNLARDASGWFDIEHYRNMTEYNEVSSYLNALIMQHIQQVADSSFASGRSCRVCGAVELALDQPLAEAVTLIPFELEFIP